MAPRLAHSVGRFAPALGALLATACASLPASTCFAPETSGVVLRDGQPVAGARVRLAAPLAGEDEGATTDELGRFVVGPLTNYQFTVKQIGVAHFAFTVQIAAAGTAVQGYAADGEGEAPRKLALRCDLGASAAARRGVCVAMP